MKVETIKEHLSRHGRHLPGDVYEEVKSDAEAKIRRGLVREQVEKKKIDAAPENKKARGAAETKSE